MIPSSAQQGYWYPCLQLRYLVDPGQQYCGLEPSIDQRYRIPGNVFKMVNTAGYANAHRMYIPPHPSVLHIILYQTQHVQDGIICKNFINHVNNFPFMQYSPCFTNIHQAEMNNCNHL